MLVKYSGEIALITKSTMPADSLKIFSILQLFAGFLQFYTGDELERGHVQMKLKVSLKRAHRQIQGIGKRGDGLCGVVFVYVGQDIIKLCCLLHDQAIEAQIIHCTLNGNDLFIRVKDRILAGL